MRHPCRAASIVEATDGSVELFVDVLESESVESDFKVGDAERLAGPCCCSAAGATSGTTCFRSR